MRACRLDSRCSILLVLLAAAAVLGSPVSLAAEPAQVVRLGFVSPFSPSTDVRSVDGFWQRLRELGWVEGQNLIIEARWSEGRTDRLPALMSEVIERKIDVLVTYSTPGALAAKKATSTIPIVWGARVSGHRALGGPVACFMNVLDCCLCDPSEGTDCVSANGLVARRWCARATI